MKKKGVWAVYFYDYGPILSKVYARELEARRNAVPNFHHVIFLPFGADFDEIVRGK
jgi:hypothetical protein